MRLPQYLTEIAMRLLWKCHKNTLRIPWVFPKITLRLPWDYPWDDPENTLEMTLRLPLRLPWDYPEIIKRLPWDYHESQKAYVHWKFHCELKVCQWVSEWVSQWVRFQYVELASQLKKPPPHHYHHHHPGYHYNLGSSRRPMKLFFSM